MNNNNDFRDNDGADSVVNGNSLGHIQFLNPYSGTLLQTLIQPLGVLTQKLCISYDDDKENNNNKMLLEYCNQLLFK